MFWTGRRTTTLYRSGAFQMFQAFRTFNPSRCSGSLEWMAHPQSQKASHTLAQVHGCWREPPPPHFPCLNSIICAVHRLTTAQCFRHLCPLCSQSIQTALSDPLVVSSILEICLHVTLINKFIVPCLITVLPGMTPRVPPLHKVPLKHVVSLVDREEDNEAVTQATISHG